jgi:hypothetical protein
MPASVATGPWEGYLDRLLLGENEREVRSKAAYAASASSFSSSSPSGGGYGPTTASCADGGGYGSVTEYEDTATAAATRGAEKAAAGAGVRDGRESSETSTGGAMPRKIGRTNGFSSGRGIAGREDSSAASSVGAKAAGGGRASGRGAAGFGLGGAAEHPQQITLAVKIQRPIVESDR